MRWHTTDDELALFGLDDLVGPKRSTGRMSDLQFLHVVAKRILNHTPAPSRAPSSWTINVYRGCSHACVYCLGGDTLVLTSDGRTRRIADLRPGDAVYGTIGSGASRRYVPTLVHDHWSTLRRAYRVTLADGTELIASGDHRFLTDLGWKHVVAASASDQRPHLTADNRLLGFGQLPPTAPAGEDYRRGYLTGSIRGDAHVGSYRYPRSGRTSGEVHRFRLALADLEPLDRTASYLAAAGITTDRFQFAPASETRREMTAIRTQRSDDVAAIRQLIVWPIRPSTEWQRGFLAGIFDAEGSHSCGVLRISTANREIVDHVLDASRALGFDVVLEPAQPNGVRTIRLLGGLRERLRFLHLTDVATTRKRTIDGTAVRSRAPLRVVSVVDLGIDLPMYDITTGTGDFVANGVISHNCFARPTHEYLGLDTGHDFDTKIVVKINAVEKLRVELADPRWQHEPVAMGTNTDPYQRAEAKYRLTRGVVEALTEHANPFSILTKSPLVTRDLDVLRRAADVTDVSVNFSLGTLDERVWRATEPGTPNPRRRVDAMARLSEAGIRTGALVAPVLPGLSDSAEQLQEVVAAVAGAGGRVLGLVPLHLRPGVREHFLTWLREADPALHADYLRRYADRAYAPKHYAAELYRRAGLGRR